MKKSQLPQMALLIAALSIGSAGIAGDAFAVTDMVEVATGAVAILTAALLAIAIPVQAGVPTPWIREAGVKGPLSKQFARVA